MAIEFLKIEDVLYNHQDQVGISIRADEDGLVEITLRVAMGQAGKKEIAAFFRSIAG